MRNIKVVPLKPIHGQETDRPLNASTEENVAPSNKIERLNTEFLNKLEEECELEEVKEDLDLPNPKLIDPKFSEFKSEQSVMSTPSIKSLGLKSIFSKASKNKILPTSSNDAAKNTLNLPLRQSIYIYSKMFNQINSNKTITSLKESKIGSTIVESVVFKASNSEDLTVICCRILAFCMFQTILAAFLGKFTFRNPDTNDCWIVPDEEVPYSEPQGKGGEVNMAE